MGRARLHAHTHTRAPLLRLTLAALALAASGCELSASDLTAYSRTAAGPAKIRVVIEEGKYADELRAEAVVTLLDLERDDVDGKALAFESLERVEPEAREEILLALLSLLGPRIAQDSPLSPEVQVQSKDALTRLALMSERDAVRSRYGALLIEWYARDLGRRARAGRRMLSPLVDELGPLAAAPLTQALQARGQAGDVRHLASLLSAVARGEDRERAAERLLEIETRWRSDGRLALLQSELAERSPELRDEPAGGDEAEAQGESLLRVRAEAQRQAELEQALLPALGWFADTAAVSQRLLAIAQSRGKLPETQREMALTLLTGHTSEDQVGALLALASDYDERPALRELALERAAEHAGSQALPQLLAIMSNRKQQALRQRAAELVLEIGGGGALNAFFRAMPKAWALDFSRSELEAYAERMAAIEPEPHIMHYLGGKMHSPYWWARVLAMRYYAQRAQGDELWRIRQHLHDYTQVRGSEFPDGYTIGQEAQAAVAMALRRLRGESEPG